MDFLFQTVRGKQENKPVCRDGLAGKTLHDHSECDKYSNRTSTGRRDSTQKDDPTLFM